MQTSTACPYCAVQLPDGADTCAICKNPVPSSVRKTTSSAPRARTRSLDPPEEQVRVWDMLAGGAALFLAILGATVALVLI